MVSHFVCGNGFIMFNRSLALVQIDSYRAYAQQHYPSLCQPRPENSHKGTFGTVAIVGGSKGMVGASVLAATSAMYTGCGKVLVGLNHVHNPPAVFHNRPEIMVDYAVDMVTNYHHIVDTWVVGCGLSKNETAVQILKALWNSSITQLVLDADALPILAEHSELFPPQHKRTDLVITPHPGEAAKLLNVSIERIEQNRDWAARELASRYRAWVILKGHDTLISSARGFLLTNPSGNAGLATAGSGDVLAGIVGSLLAQGIEAEEAVPAAVWLHGVAAEVLVQMQIGPIGMLAGELAEAVRWVRNQLTLTVESEEQTTSYDKDFI